ncbi:hypothetical protein NIES2101_23995 [Calothrix sp. HK-06]|nr:hypothetical protein NIES2101_23860 [Calothrix sp. HK-06]OKH47330.1 hypothetical protein NIES2101_23995 [Calothrix sp. HK-06]
MKIAIDIGHNLPCDGGAVGFLNENWCNTAVGMHLISMLEKSQVEVIKCKPGSADDLRDSLKRRVTTANTAKADYYISLHHNAGGGKGSEVFYFSNKGGALASAIVNELALLGFENRGAKKSTHYYVINWSEMPAIIVEACFMDTKTDCELWQRVGAKAVAEAIYKGLNQVLKFSSTPVSA